MPSFWEIQRVASPGDLLDDMATYVSMPNEPGTKPAVIVIQEVFGVSGHIQNVADRFAKAGYFAVAPAIFHRENTTEGVRGTNPMFSYAGLPGAPPNPEDEEARGKAVGNWKDEEIILDINTTISWLQNHPRVLGDRIGIVGFCAGGRITYLAASACPGLGAAVNFYGGGVMRALGNGPSPFDRAASIMCPVMGNFGELDQNPTPDEVRQMEAELKKHGKTHDFKIYPGAGHGFLCDERSSYDEPSAKDAWERTLGWFQKYLSPVAAKS